MIITYLDVGYMVTLHFTESKSIPPVTKWLQTKFGDPHPGLDPAKARYYYTVDDAWFLDVLFMDRADAVLFDLTWS